MKKSLSLLLVLVASIFISAATSAQSIADAAKQKATKKVSRTITNDDIPSRPLDELPKDSAETAKPEGDSGSSTDKPENTTDDKNDSPEVVALNRKLQELNDSIEHRKKRVAEYEEKIKVETNDDRLASDLEVKSAMEEDLKTMNEQKDSIEKQIAELKQKEKSGPENSEAQ